MEKVMEKLLKEHLSPKLENINKEINEFKPNLSILSRKLKSNIKSKLVNWFESFIEIFHELVQEFDPLQLEMVEFEINQAKKKNPTLHLLILQFLKYHPVDLEKICSSCLGKSSFYELKLNCEKGPSELGEWINNYSNKIYRPPDGWIYILENYVRNSTNPQLKILGKKVVQQMDLYNEFMSFQIQREIEKGFRYKYHYDDNQLEFWVESNSIISKDSYYWKFLYARMKVIGRLHHQTKKIRFKIVLSDTKKKLPTKRLFGPREVNSGSTDYQTINIWRSEEHYKLLIHESIHFYNLDGSYDLFEENNKINLECLYQIGDDNETRIYESYTESLTIFFHTFANAYQIFYLSNKNKSSNSNLLSSNSLSKSSKDIILKIWEDLWFKEKKFALLQVAKIYHHVNPKSDTFQDFLITSEKNCQKERNENLFKLEQRTSVLSYHFLKTVNLIFDQEFLEWIKNIKKPHPGSLIKFKDFIHKKTHNPEFVKCVDIALNHIKKKKISKNMRMTFYDVI